MKYPVILADPPWHYQNYSTTPGQVHMRARGAARHYPTMTVDQLSALEVPVADDAVLLMWAVWPLMVDAFKVITAWGFEYKTLAWVWVKLNRNSMGLFYGMGNYTRSNSEPCLLAVRGNAPKATAHDIQSVIMTPIQEHSRKPDEQYAKIESLFPNLPYLEMFARRARPGWDVWGNQAPNSIELPLFSGEAANG